EDVIANLALSDKVVCRFDFHGTAEGGAPATKRYSLAANGILANSRYSQSDLTGEGEPRAGELDYATLKLAEPVGAMRISNDRQGGCYKFLVDSPVVAIHDFIVIPQHAEGNKL